MEECGEESCTIKYYEALSGYDKRYKLTKTRGTLFYSSVIMVDVPMMATKTYFVINDEIHDELNMLALH